VTFYAPGCEELSPDEAWLMRALERARAGDHASPDFLIASRVPKPWRRQMGFLINNLARRLDTV
jgi:hypothetical protein